VVGVGLPQISPERDIIARHFAKLNGLGFEYAYMYPGMNRVLQAAGRVIRTAQDRGFVLLIDDRFLHKRYLSLFPPQWQHYHKVYSPDTVSNILSQFWG
jgi:DNA excision repair protein ERCC-2